MFVDVFAKLFQCFKHDLTPIDVWMSKYSYRTLEDFVKGSYMSPGTLERIKKAQERGLSVYVGEMSSDNGEIESFFCCDSFVIEGDNIIFDATNDAW